MVQDVPDALADLVEIACYVYCADQLTRRDTPKMHGLGENFTVQPVGSIRLQAPADQAGWPEVDDRHDFDAVPAE
jgi:hypothetical protein